MPDRLEVLVRQLQGLLGGKAQRSGSGLYDWPGGSALSTVATINHGLPQTPTSIVATPWAQHVSLRITSRSATQFTVQARTLDGSSPAALAAQSFGWHASA